MPAPLPPDQLTIVRNLIAKGDTAGAIKVYIEATGATEAEAKAEVNHLASRYGLVGTQVPDLFVRRTAPTPKPAPPVEVPPTPAVPAPVAQQAANVPLEPVPPAPTPVTPLVPAAPAPTPVPAAQAPTPAPAPAPAQTTPTVSVPKATARPASTPQPAASASTPSTKKSRWGCSSVLVLFGGVLGVAWWALA